MKNCRCDLCGSEDYKAFPAFITRPESVVICRVCNLIYTNPAWDEVEIKHIYDEVFRDDPGAKLNSERADFEEYRTSKFEKAAHQVENYLLPLINRFVEPNGKKWLDVRFRAGALPVALNDLGATVYAVDIFAANAGWLEKKLPNARIYRREIYHLLDFADKDFDVISMVTTHVAAHSPSPTALFRAAFEKLKPCGILLVDEKDVTQISPKAALFPFQYPYGMAHYHHLTLPTARIFLQKAGFEIISAEYTEKFSAQRHFLIVARKPNVTSEKTFDLTFDDADYKQIYRGLVRKFLKIRLQQKSSAALKKLKKVFGITAK